MGIQRKEHAEDTQISAPNADTCIRRTFLLKLGMQALQHVNISINSIAQIAKSNEKKDEALFLCLKI